MFRQFANRCSRSMHQAVRHRSDEILIEETKRFEKSVNQVNILGRVGRDAETRGTESHPVVLFSVATNVLYTKGDGTNMTRTDWHRISVFKPGLREKIAANIKKGDRVYVSGSIQYDDYRDNDTTTRTATVLATDIVNLTKRYLTAETVEEDE